MENQNEHRTDIERIRARVKEIELYRENLIKKQEVLKANKTLSYTHRQGLKTLIEQNQDLINDTPSDFYGTKLSIPNERKHIYLDEAFKMQKPRNILSKQIYYVSPSDGSGFLDRYFSLNISNINNGSPRQKIHAFYYTYFEKPAEAVRFYNSADALEFEKENIIIMRNGAYEDVTYDDIYVEYMNVLLLFGQDEADQILKRYFEITYPEDTRSRHKFE